jgi:hypothetical protein
MKNIELLQKVADLVGFKFSSSTHKFAEIDLFDGSTITNNASGEFAIGDKISIKNDDNTLSVVAEGDYTSADGLKIYSVDADGMLIEIADATKEGTEDGSTTENAPIDSVVASTESSQMEALKAAIHDVLFAFEAHAKEIADLKAELHSFKNEAKHNPLKEDTLMSNAFSGDRRYEILRQMKETNKK